MTNAAPDNVATKRLLTMAIAIGAYFLAYFYRVSPAAISKELTEAFQTSATSLGLLSATYFYITTAMQIPTGVMADRIGARALLTGGCLIAGVGSIVFGVASTFEIAMIGRTMVGLGTSVLFIAMLKLITVWYAPNRFSSVAGVAMILGASGSVAAGAPLAALVQAMSWRTFFIVLGLLTIAIAAISLKTVTNKPTGDTASGVTTMRSTWRDDLLFVLSSKQIWIGALINFGITGSFMSFASLWAVPYLVQSLGYTGVEASAHTSMYFVAFSVGSLLIGSVSDFFQKRKLFIIFGSVFYFIIYIVLIFDTGLSKFETYSIFTLMGLFACSFTLTWASAKESMPASMSGMAMAVVNTGGFLGGAILQPLAGWLMDLTWGGQTENGLRIYSASDYESCLMIHAAMAFVGVVSAFFLKETAGMKRQSEFMEKKARLLNCMARLTNEAAHKIVLELKDAPSEAALTFLKTEIFQILALEYGEAQARQKLDDALGAASN